LYLSFYLLIYYLVNAGTSYALPAEGRKAFSDFSEYLPADGKPIDQLLHIENTLSCGLFMVTVVAGLQAVI